MGMLLVTLSGLAAPAAAECWETEVAIEVGEGSNRVYLDGSAVVWLESNGYAGLQGSQVECYVADTIVLPDSDYAAICVVTEDAECWDPLVSGELAASRKDACTSGVTVPNVCVTGWAAWNWRNCHMMSGWQYCSAYSYGKGRGTISPAILDGGVAVTMYYYPQGSTTGTGCYIPLFVGTCDTPTRENWVAYRNMSQSFGNSYWLEAKTCTYNVQTCSPTAQVTCYMTMNKILRECFGAI